MKGLLSILIAMTASLSLKAADTARVQRMVLSLSIDSGENRMLDRLAVPSGDTISLSRLLLGQLEARNVHGFNEACGTEPLDSAELIHRLDRLRNSAISILVVEGGDPASNMGRRQIKSFGLCPGASLEDGSAVAAVWISYEELKEIIAFVNVAPQNRDNSWISLENFFDEGYFTANRVYQRETPLRSKR